MMLLLADLMGAENFYQSYYDAEINLGV